MGSPPEGCVLYVDHVERAEVVRDLAQRFGVPVADPGTLRVGGVEVRVGKNTAARADAGAGADFPDWPLLVEVYPAETAALGEEVVAVTVEVVRRLRRSGHRVVAVPDVDISLPRWDDLRTDRVPAAELDDGAVTGDDRYWRRGELVTGTVEDRRPDGSLLHETEVRNGVRDGLSRMYRDDGRLRREDWYDAGVRVRKRRWHPNGTPELDMRRRPDDPELTGSRWREDGSPVRPGLWRRMLGRPLVDTEPGWH